MQNIWIFYQDGGTPKQGWGDRHYFLAKEYIKRGYTVTIFAGNNCHRYTHPVRFKGQFLYEKNEGVHYCWVKVPAYSESISLARIFSWFLFAFKLFFVSKAKVGRPDVVVVSSIPMFPIVTGIFYKWRFKAKLIFEIRDIWPLTVIQVGNFSKYHPFVMLLRWIELWGYRKSDHLVSVLQSADDHIRNSIGPKFKFTWISNGFSPEYLQNVEQPGRELLEQIPDKFIVGYTGTLGSSNANEFLIDAARVLCDQPTIHFVIIGDGPEKSRLIGRAEGLNNVTFIPKVPKKYIQATLRRFSVAYVGSRQLDIYRYGISANKMFDYMNAGLPIILSSQFDKNLVSAANCGFTVTPESGQAIADAVLKVFDMSQQERQRLGTQGKQFAQDHFLYQKLADKFIAIFEN